MAVYKSPVSAERKQMRLSARQYKRAMKRGQIRLETTELVNAYPVSMSGPEPAKASRVEFTVSFEYEKAKQHGT